MPATETPPDKAETTDTSTDMTAQLKAQADASLQAVPGKGFKDPEFEKALQQAMDKDAGKEPVVETQTTQQQPPPDAAIAAEKAAKAAELASKQEELRKIQEAAGDIPGVLLGEKAPEKKVVTQDDATREAERQKFIKEQTKDMSPKAADRFKAIEARAHEAEEAARKLAADRQAEADALKKQLEELNKKVSSPPDTSEADKLKKQIEEMEAIIKQRELLEDPRFKAHFDGQIDAQLEDMKKLVTTEQGDELSQIAMLPDSKKRKERIKELTEELDDLDRIKVLSKIASVDEIKAKRAKEIDDWKNNRVHVEAGKIEEQKKKQLEMEEAKKHAWSVGLENVTSAERGLEVFRKLDGDDVWNAKVDARIATVQKMLSSDVNPVELAARAVAVDDYRKMFLAQRILVQKLSEELASLKTVQPDAGDDGGGGTPVDETANMSFTQAAVHGAVKSGALKAS